MNQRKLIGALSILLLAILFITVGCGDGKRNTRARLNKTIPHNKGTRLPDPNSKEAKAQRAQRDQAQTEFDRAIQGEKIQELLEGSYKLTEIVSYVNFMNNTNEEVRYFRRISFNQQGASLGQQIGAGIFRNNPDRGRQLIAPVNFQMNAGAPITADLSQSILFSTQLKDDASNMSVGLRILMEDQVTNATAGAQATSLVDFLPKAQTSVRTKDGKAADVFILKLGADKVAVQVAISEVAQPGKQGNISQQAANVLTRNVVFIYAFQPKAAAPPQQQQTQTPTEDTGEGAPSAPATAE